MIEAYKELAGSYRLYWRLYGGWSAVLTSPYFHLALVITALTSPKWLAAPATWSNAAVNILPNLMGFSIAGMAIFLAFSNESTMKAVTEDGQPDSYFVSTIANFFHFILVQTVALILGFVGQYFQSFWLTGPGVLTLAYALTISLAMAMQLLRTSQIINAAESLPDEGPSEDKDVSR